MTKVEKFRKCIRASGSGNEASAMAAQKYNLIAADFEDQRAWEEANDAEGWPFSKAKQEAENY